MGGGRIKLLDAAEVLFATRGIDATSARAINAAAGLSPAALHYHFGSKDNLVDELLYRRMDEINRVRKEVARHLSKSRDPSDAYPLAEILVLPEAELVFRGNQERCYLRFFARLFAEKPTLIQDYSERTFGPEILIFEEMIRATAPEMDLAESRRRRRVAVQTCASSLAQIASELGEGHADRQHVEPLILSLVEFIAGGMSAPLRSRFDRPPAAVLAAR